MNNSFTIRRFNFLIQETLLEKLFTDKLVSSDTYEERDRVKILNDEFSNRTITVKINKIRSAGKSLFVHLRNILKFEEY